MSIASIEKPSKLFDQSSKFILKMKIRVDNENELDLLNLQNGGLVALHIVSNLTKMKIASYTAWMEIMLMNGCVNFKNEY